MVLTAFQTTFAAIVKLVFLGFVGFALVKRSIIHEEGLKTLNDLVIGLFLPLFMFSEITQRFSFGLYADWWLFPLYSFVITAAGFGIGSFVLKAVKSLEPHRGEFLGITSFQNSGYLPLPLVAALLPEPLAREMFIFIFLFLLGFNMTIFSFGVMLLSGKKKPGEFEARHIFNAPVVATLLALACVFFGLNNYLPRVLTEPMELLGRCAVPLSILVVGGNLASIKTNNISDFRPLGYALAIKLFILPLFFLGLLILMRPAPLVGLLILLQAAMPPAAMLSVIAKNKDSSDCLINQSIFYGHILSILTIPLFLVLYWLLAGKSF